MYYFRSDSLFCEIRSSSCVTACVVKIVASVVSVSADLSKYRPELESSE